MPSALLLIVDCYLSSIDSGIYRDDAGGRGEEAKSVIGRARSQNSGIARKEGWTQETLAEKTDLDRSYIAGIEAGLRNPSAKALAKIAHGFGLSLSEFFESVG